MLIEYKNSSTHTNFMHTENDLRPIVACASLTQRIIIVVLFF